MSTTQVQLKISLSPQLNELLAAKAARVGIPVTQMVKHLIIKDVENTEYPTYEMSKRTEKKTKEAMRQVDKAVDATDFLKKIK